MRHTGKSLRYDSDNWSYINLVFIRCKHPLQPSSLFDVGILVFIRGWTPASQTDSPHIFPRHARSCESPAWNPIPLKHINIKLNISFFCFQLMLSLFFKVSLFLKDQIQNPNGRFALTTSGPVPHGTDVPGLIRYVGYSVCRWFTYSFEMNFKESINVNQKYVLSHICHCQCNRAFYAK